MKNQTTSLEFSHFPVMLSEIIDISSPSKGGFFVDCTFGGGGYTKGILKIPKTKIKQLRNVIPEASKTKWSVLNEDMTLYRFLQARKWIVEDAWKMLEAHLNWRSETYSS